jgi:hypothetical protein
MGRPAGPTSASGSVWAPPAPRLPFGNHDIHVAELGGALFVSGGLAWHILDPRTGRWREGPPLRVARIECVSLAVGGRVYTFGGASHSAGVESIGRTEAAWRCARFAGRSCAAGCDCQLPLHPASATVSHNGAHLSPSRPEPVMPVGLRQFGGCVLDGKVYLVGVVSLLSCRNHYDHRC